MLSDEEKKAINKMKLFARVSEDMTVVTANDMNLVVTLVEKQQKEIEELKTNKGYHIGFIDGGIAKRYEYEDKIKAKIEELEKDFKEYENGQEWEIQDEIRGQIEVLQSLLEKE